MGGKGAGGGGYALPVMPLEAKVLRPRDSVDHPHLAHVVRLGGDGVVVDDVFDGEGEDLAVGVAGEGGGRVGGEDEEDGAREVGGRFGGHPAVVVGGVFGVFWFGDFGGFFELARGGGSVVVVGVGGVGGGGALALFGLFVAFEGEGFDHCGGSCRCCCGGGGMEGK